MKTILLSTLLVIAACGDGLNKPTHGDLVSELAFHYCTERVECGFSTYQERDICIRHNVHHLCELEDTCDKEIDPELFDVLDECTAGIDAYSEEGTCGLLFFGAVPEECSPLFEIDLD